jgi:cytochrome d ubiquinol oxidase subunit II
MRMFYEGTGLFELLNPFGLLCGLVSLAMLVSHGATYLVLKTEGAVNERARWVASRAPFVTAALFLLGGVWIAFGVKGYVITNAIPADGPSNPLLKTVVQAPGAWLTNYGTHPWMTLAPILGVAGALLTAFLSSRGKAGLAFVASGVGILGIIATAGVSMFPFLMPSSIEPSSSLTVWDASSSQRTLFVMLIATLIFLPLVLAYTSWVFYTLRGPVTASQVRSNSSSLY